MGREPSVDPSLAGIASVPVVGVESGTLRPSSRSAGDRVDRSEQTLPQCTLSWDPIGFVVCVQDVDVVQTTESAQQLLSDLESYSSTGRVPLLVHMNGQRTTRGAREVLAGHGAFGAVAMVLTSKVGTLLVNFFLRINRPSYPMQVFANEDEARAWISQHAIA